MLAFHFILPYTRLELLYIRIYDMYFVVKGKRAVKAMKTRKKKYWCVFIIFIYKMYTHSVVFISCIRMFIYMLLFFWLKKKR